MLLHKLVRLLCAQVYIFLKVFVKESKNWAFNFVKCTKIAKITIQRWENVFCGPRFCVRHQHTKSSSTKQSKKWQER